MLRSRSLLLSSAFASLALTAVLAGCGGGGGAPSPLPGQTAPAPAASVASLSYNQLVAIPAWKPGVSPSYDISFNNGKYNVLADRTSKGVDIVNDATFNLVQVTSPLFTGFSGNNSTSGPDGVVWDSTHDLFYVGDVNKVVIVNANTSTVVGSVVIPQPGGSATGSGNRTDEGCYDPVDHIMMFANNADAPPYATFINTNTNTVMTQYVFPADSVGAEQCVWNGATSSFYVNNVGDNTHPGGALDQITAASVIAAAAAGTNVPTLPESAEYDETAAGIGCNPAGLAVGSDSNMLVGCGDVNSSANGFTPGTTAYVTANQIYGPGKQQHSLIMDKTGNIVTVVPYGGSDEVWFDPKKNRYYAAARYWTTTGLTGGTPFTSIGIISLGGSLVGTLPTVGNVHSVAADPLTGNVFVPQQSTSSAQGGESIYIAH